MNDATRFLVIRHCDDCGLASECGPDCNCDHVAVEVDVDELTAVEVAHLRAHGTAAQRAEIRAYLNEEIPMTVKTTPATRPDFYTLDNSDARALPGEECDCGHEDCLVCLVQSLEGPGPEVVGAAA